MNRAFSPGAARSPWMLVMLVVALFACVAAVRGEDGRLGVIHDKDGFTNVHQEASQQSKIVGVVHKDERFRVFPNDGKWWRIRTAAGLEGFVHESRIRLLEEPEPAKTGN